MNYHNADYDVRWESVGKSSSDSMPLGNGDLAANVWTDRDGLAMYLAKSDAWDENGRLVKLGRVRVRIDGITFDAGPFEQCLCTQTAQVLIHAGQPQVCVRVWIDANHPVLHIEVDAQQPVTVRAEVQLWRTAPRTLKGQELQSAYGQKNAPHATVVAPDTVLPATATAVQWCHRNPSSIWAESMQLQGFEDLMPDLIDPLLHRTFGCLLEGEGLLPVSDTAIASATPKKHWHLCIHAQTQTPSRSTQDWATAISEQAQSYRQHDLASHRQAHERWWSDFWQRSYIHVTDDQAGAVVTSGYALQRFITACAGRGAYPIKFNGSLFTVDTHEPQVSAPADKQLYDADYRRWGGPYWFQNTRLSYWPMFAAGDLDLMVPLFRMFINCLPIAQERARKYFGHDGAMFPETMMFWGTYANDNFGWDRNQLVLSPINTDYS